MKIKTVEEQLIDMGFKTGDKIKIKGYGESVAYTLDLENEKIKNDKFSYKLKLLYDEDFEKYTPTKEELIEELKKRSKKFEKDIPNCRIYYNFDNKKVSWANTYIDMGLTELYFTKGEAKKIADELNADRDKIKILFDLEE